MHFGRVGSPLHPFLPQQKNKTQTKTQNNRPKKPQNKLTNNHFWKKEKKERKEITVNLKLLKSLTVEE